MIAIKNRNLAYVYILLTALIFSTAEIAGKLVVIEINPVQLNFYRFFVGSLVLLPWAVRELGKRKLALGMDDWAFFFRVGFLGIALAMTLYHLALVFAKASIVAIISSINPIFIIPIANILLKEKITARTLASLALSIIGIVAIFNPFAINSDAIGIVLAILFSVNFSLYSVLIKRQAARYGSVVLTCFSCLAGSFSLLAYIFVSNLPLGIAVSGNAILRLLWPVPLLAGINAANILPVLYLGAVVNGLGYLLYFLAMEKTSASTGSVVFFIKPALASLLAFLILGEDLAASTLIGIVLITASTYIAYAGSE